MSQFWWGPSVESGAARAASMEASHAKGEASRAGVKVEQLEARLERTLLACEAMWSLLRERLGVTDDELAQRITDIDLSDGQLDGKVRRPPATCNACGRTVSPRFPKCMYCGAALERSPFA